ISTRSSCGRKQVRPSNIADEQGVAGEDPVGRGIVAMLVDHDADRLRGVPGSGSNLKSDLAEVETLIVGEEIDREVDLRATAVRDDGAGPGELEVAGEKVGVTMSLDDPLDSQPGRCRVDEVGRDVAAGVDHDRAAC